VGFTRNALSGAVSACRESPDRDRPLGISERNLARGYRDLGEPPRFPDPDNAEINKAVATARIQLDGIKKKT